MPLSADDNDWLFDAMAQAIDQVGSERSALLLAKFAMLLSNQVGERNKVEQALKSALANLAPDSSSNPQVSSPGLSKPLPSQTQPSKPPPSQS